MKSDCSAVVKFSIAFLLLFCFLTTGFAQTMKEVNPEVQSVTVFLNRAQVFCTAQTNVGAGQTEIVLTNIPSAIDVNSIQVDAKGEVTLYGVRYENNYLQRPVKPKELVVAEDSLTYYQSAVRNLNDQIDILHKEEGLIMANQNAGGQKGVTADELEDLADLFRSRLTTIRGLIMKNEIRQKKMNEGVQRFTSVLGDLSGKRIIPNGRILITVSAENATSVVFNFSYVVYNAGWQPIYDLRATNTKSPVKLFYKANVYQNTGVSWKNVAITLTTNNPTFGATKPELQPWYLDFYTGVMDAKSLYGQPAVMDKLESSSEEAVTLIGSRSTGTSYYVNGVKQLAAPQLAPAKNLGSEISVSQTEIAAEFKINVSYTIPADGKKHLIDVQQYEMKASYVYSAVPKLAPEAFLVGRITGWEEYNILPGEANIFMEGTFTGKTFLDPKATGDTLPVSLGRDKRVVLTREKVKELKSKSFLGGSRKETSGYLITIRNTKDQPIDLTVEDQIPVSNNKEIEVELEESSGGSFDKTTGKITWQLKLNPAETKRIPLRFSVKYPKNKPISGI